MLKKPRILVVGSLAMDLIVSTEKFPSSGETVIGKSFSMAPGGKGANQAVQAARCGASVEMVGKVGDDQFGEKLIENAAMSGIDVSRIIKDQENPTAIGNILLEVREGEKSKNRIIVAPGANMAITEEDISFLKDTISGYDMVMLQLEIPMKINELVARWANEAGVPVMLNAAPSAPLSDEFISGLSYISPNEHEASDMTGIAIRTENGINRDDVRAAASVLREKGAKNVIITLGSNGAYISAGSDEAFIPCVDVMPVADPTAAGDSFIGSFVFALCAGLEPVNAMYYASFASTLTVSKMGAQPSLPTNEEICALMKKENYTGFDIDQLENIK